VARRNPPAAVFFQLVCIDEIRDQKWLGW
jgi:hypothetical protein